MLNTQLSRVFFKHRRRKGPEHLPTFDLVKSGKPVDPLQKTRPAVSSRNEISCFLGVICGPVTREDVD
jgi:hypothetical protein